MSELEPETSKGQTGVSQDSPLASNRQMNTPQDRLSASKQQSRKRPLWKQIITLIVVLLAVPATIALGVVINRRAYLLVSLIIIVLSMVPFFVSFEKRRPHARELVVLAVMIAMAVASRVVFAFVPQFKPLVGVVIITGIAFGGPTGFLAGSVAAFVSNFIFGQGPWTPFQMLGYGLAGYFFGLLADAGAIPRGKWSALVRIVVSLGAGLFVLCVTGPILDTSSLMWMVRTITPESMLTLYLAGAPMNALHAAATFVTVLLVGNPILDKLARLKMKYGFME